ncbi:MULTISPECIES: hypothetical protein [Bacillus cereus group]|uniref:hypothetical protein n=1 Tax=Bacillus cereus group TaxID=86661 RepID=UPI0015933145|nr:MULTISPECIES: hypothetical protein [Bacillus cereus group]MCU5635353.1 hypothetical protein [Bacillus cereus]
MKTKCILSLRLARKLLANGLQLIDIEQSKKIPGTLVFVFEHTEALEEELIKLGK